MNILFIITNQDMFIQHQKKKTILIPVFPMLLIQIQTFSTTEVFDVILIPTTTTEATECTNS